MEEQPHEEQMKHPSQAQTRGAHFWTKPLMESIFLLPGMNISLSSGHYIYYNKLSISKLSSATWKSCQSIRPTLIYHASQIYHFHLLVVYVHTINAIIPRGSCITWCAGEGEAMGARGQEGKGEGRVGRRAPFFQ